MECFISMDRHGQNNARNIESELKELLCLRFNEYKLSELIKDNTNDEID